MELDIDGLTPGQIASPRDAADLAQVLRDAADGGSIVAPLGGGTMLDLGVPLNKIDVAISLAKLDRVLDYQPANLTVRTEAGITLGALNRILGEHGQCVPLDPPCPSRATIGGILSTNASGPMRIRFGSARDLLIGIRVALPDGQIVKGGGQVVKNVAGYDLPKLFIGALGTLGVVVEATFKLSPVPRQTSTLLAEFADLASACAVAQRTLSSPLLPIGGLVLNQAASRQFQVGDKSVLLARFGGIAQAVARQLNDVTQWTRANGNVQSTTMDDDQNLWSRLSDFAAENDTVLKIGVLPTEIVQVGNTAEELASRSGVSCSFTANAVGILLVAVKGSADGLTAFVTQLRQSVLDVGGHLVVQRAPRTLREQIDVWGPLPNVSIMQKLKQEFDPKGILNPGRLV